MKISVFRLPDTELSLSFEEPVDQFPMLAEMDKTGECRFSTPVSFQADLKKERDIIRLEGNLSFSVAVPCRRCLAECALDLSRRFQLYFTDTLMEPDGTLAEEGVTFTAEQAGVVRFTGHEIDLREPIQEQVILTLPLYHLCGDACKGLCVACGANLNREACTCSRSKQAHPFAALKKLKLN